MRLLLANALLAYTAKCITPVYAELPSSTIVDVSKLFRHHDYLSQKIRQKADFRLNHEEYYRHRIVTEAPSAASANVTVSSPTSNAAPTAQPATEAAMTVAPSTNITSVACIKALSALNGQASNPSGLAVCYNVLSLDKSTGAFHVDLQLYQMSPPSGDWASHLQQGMNVKLSYPSTTVATMYNSSIVKRGNEITSSLLPHEIQRSELTRRGTSPRMIADLNFIGSVASPTMQKASTETTLKLALLPLIILSGTAANGTPITTTLSSKEASFLTGVFAKPQILPTPSKARVSQSVLPGTRLGIFPTGLIITGVWTFSFIIVVGLGTLQRQGQRQAYRRRMKVMRSGVRAPYGLKGGGVRDYLREGVRG